MLGGAYREQPIYGRAGTCILVDTAIFHTRLDGDGRAGRRLMHHVYARGGWLQLGGGGRWRAPSPVNNPHNLFPERLAAHPDPEQRVMFSLWSASMCEWAAGGFDPAYRAARPTKGSPDPTLRSEGAGVRSSGRPAAARDQAADRRPTAPCARPRGWLKGNVGTGGGT